MRSSDWSADVCSSDLADRMQARRLNFLDEFNGDITRFKGEKILPSRLHQVGIAKTEPGDENNQDISSLVGKVDIRKLENLSQHDPDAYSYSGGLNRANQGLLEFVEMFRSEEHTSELQSLMRISYAAFCLKKKTIHQSL